jgi:CTP synthase
LGIQPDVIVCRSDRAIPPETREKIALFCDVEPEAVIGMPTASTIYEVPLILEREGLGNWVASRFDLVQKPELTEWEEMVAHIETTKKSVRVGLVGKYVDLHDAYLSVTESLMHAGLHHDVDVDVAWINSETATPEELDRELRRVSGIVVPGGFGPRGVDGKIFAAKFAREQGIPYFGLCYGLHIAVIEFARNVCGLDGANSTEIEPQTPHPVIDLMPGQHGVEMGGTMRRGLWPCTLLPGTRAALAYGTDDVAERHRHRFEVSNAYRSQMEGASPDDYLAEIMEITEHPFFVGVQFHPEFRSRPNRPHPLFREFVKAAKATLPENSQRALPLDDNKAESPYAAERDQAMVSTRS